MKNVAQLLCWRICYMFEWVRKLQLKSDKVSSTICPTNTKLPIKYTIAVFFSHSFTSKAIWMRFWTCHTNKNVSFWQMYFGYWLTFAYLDSFVSAKTASIALLFHRSTGNRTNSKNDDTAGCKRLCNSLTTVHCFLFLAFSSSFPTGIGPKQ